MDLKQLSECDSPLVGRVSYIFRAGFSGQKTPSEAEVRKAVADKLKKDAKLVAVESIKQDYGNASATIEVHIYKNLESMKKFGEVPPEEEKKEEEKKE